MSVKRKHAVLAASIALAGLAPAIALPTAAAAQVAVVSSNEVHAGQLDVPVNKSQVVRSDRPFAKALIGNPEIADVLPLTNSSLYVLGKKTGTTSLTLYDRRNRVQSRATLLDDVWGIQADVTTRTVDTHVKRLREKLGAAGDYIETVRGVGYRFTEEPGGTS